MSEEPQVAEEQAVEGAPQAATEPPAPDSDDVVEATWSVAIVPGEGASMHYRVEPKAETSAIRSVTASFAWTVHGMIEHTFAGSTFNDTKEPRAGQGAVGDMGADLTVFSKLPDGPGAVEAVLAGAVDTEGGPQTFIFTKPLPLESDEADC